jgi:hypothetical protein
VDLVVQYSAFGMLGAAFCVNVKDLGGAQRSASALHEAGTPDSRDSLSDRGTAERYTKYAEYCDRVALERDYLV